MATEGAGQFDSMLAAADSEDESTDQGIEGDAGGDVGQDDGAAVADQPEPSDETQDPTEADPDDESAAVSDDPDAVGAATTEEQQYLPYSYAVGSESVPIDGVFQAIDGSLWVSPDARESVNQAFQQARSTEAYKRENAALRRRELEKDQRFSEDVARAKKTNEFFAQLVEQGPDAVAKFLFDYDQAKGVLKAEQEKSIAKAYYEQGKQLRQTSPEVQREKDSADVTATIRSVVQSYMKEPAYKDVLTQDDWEDFGDALERGAGQMFRRATEQDRAQYPQLQPGQLVYQQSFVNQQLQWLAGILSRRQAQQSSVAKAEAFNAKRSGGTPAASPSQRARPAVTPQRSTEPKNWQEFQDDLLTPSRGTQAPIRRATA